MMKTILQYHGDFFIKIHVFSLSNISDLENSLKSFKKYVKSAQKDDKVKPMRSQKRLKMEEGNGRMQEESLLDTVGAVCMDSCGNVCSGVSSGGLLLKYPGRVGQVRRVCVL